MEHEAEILQVAMEVLADEEAQIRFVKNHLIGRKENGPRDNLKQ